MKSGCVCPAHDSGTIQTSTNTATARNKPAPPADVGVAGPASTNGLANASKMRNLVFGGGPKRGNFYFGGAVFSFAEEPIVSAAVREISGCPSRVPRIEEGARPSGAGFHTNMSVPAGPRTVSSTVSPLR